MLLKSRSRQKYLEGDTIVTIKQQTREGVPKVTFTEPAVRSSEAYLTVPNGYRVALLREVALAWKEDPSFRKALNDLPSRAWADQIGLSSSFYQKIVDNGKFVRITSDEYHTLDAKDRSLHFPGTRLAAISGYNDNNGKLYVSAHLMPDYFAHVAIVKREEPERTARRFGGLKNILRRAKSEASEIMRLLSEAPERPSE